MQQINQRAVDTIRQLELELEMVAHDVITVGSSCGAFTALRAGCQLYSLGGIKVSKILTMDTGIDWEDITGNENLSIEECELLAKNGTELYLFEQPEVGMEIGPIANLVSSGNDVTMVYCKNRGHDTISINMYRKDVFGWALGEFDELDPDEYSCVKLKQ